MTAAAGAALGSHRPGFPSSGVALASAARIASTDSRLIDTQGATGIVFVISETAHAATPSIVFTIRGVVYPGGPDANPTAVEYDILASAAITTEGTTVLTVHPAVTVAANVAASAALPDRLYIHAEAGDADSSTYSVSFILTN